MANRKINFLFCLGGRTINSINSPIYNALRKYAKSSPIPFHMPGHKIGKGIPYRLLKDLHQLDMTEIPGLDNLHFPDGVIKEAQDLAAKAFGADDTSFLVNGSTCGIHAAILGVCKPGDRLIVSRDCHKSVIGAMMLASVTPIYIAPKYDSLFGVPSLMLPSTVEEAIRNNPDAVGVVLTRPNYYGLCSDIRAISDVVRSYNKILIVDEAHGAHLRFSSKLPCCALDADADVCIQSAHKTLPALTQGAYIHIKGNRVDVDKVKFVLRLIQTSSPSYIIMAFLDIARAIMEDCGAELLDKLLKNIDCFEKMVCENTGYKILSVQPFLSGHADKTRIVVNVRNTGKTGFFIDKILRNQFNIQVEMADMYNIVCISTIADGMKEFESLNYALKEIEKQFGNSMKSPDINVKELNIPLQAVSLDKIMQCSFKKQKLVESVGKVSRGIITPYPPGVPIVCPGEVITEEAVQYITSVIQAGGTVNGVTDDGEIEILA
ncbi:MAG TPA: aminotransferase class V-fold PLP-dependent enzyme [Acetivibrio clariflavus]|nr:aminotransferase class V-fold PLP-dependent enzyme [Acetivibrio clariflavus]